MERFRRQRGVVQLRELAPIADGRAESPGESVLRLRWLDTSLPRPDLQVEVRENGLLRARLDLAVPDLRFAVEYDGWDWHSSAAQRAHDRQRRDWLRAHGWTVVVLTRREVFDQPHLAAQRIREACSRCSPVAPVDPSASATTRREKCCRGDGSASGERRLGLLADLVLGDAGGELDEAEPAALAGDRVLGVDVDDGAGR